MKIAFLCLPGLTTFIEPIIDHFEAKGNEVRRVFTGAGHVLTNAIDWADVVWLEWANELAISLTNAQNIDQLKKKMIVRLHSYEAITSLAKRVNWQPVTDVIFVADHVKKYVQKTVSSLGKANIHMIPNGIKVDQLPFLARGYPSEDDLLKLCSLGHMSHKKGPMLLLHSFVELRRRSLNCTLHIGGDWQDERFLYYFNWMIKQLELENHVFLDGNISNVPQWLEDKYAIICTSPWESQNLGIMEAMACGVRPLVHNFPGAEDIYKPQWCWNTIHDLSNLFDKEPNTSQQYRDFVKENYDFNDQIKKIEEVVGG